MFLGRRKFLQRTLGTPVYKCNLGNSIQATAMKDSYLLAMPAWPLTTLLILFFAFSSVANVRASPKLGLLQRKISHKSESFQNEGDFKTFFYEQTLDHFNYLPESYAIFKQKYVMNIKYWGGPNESAPILVFLGDEAPLGDVYRYIGFMSENAEQFRALLVYIEVKAI